MPYSSVDKPSSYFNTVTYTGTGSSNAITVGFQPDFTWIKDRSNARDHQLVNVVVGYSSGTLLSNATDAEYTAFPRVDSRDTNGFTVSTPAQVNNSGETYVAWNWKANGSGSSNTSGSITSTVSANTTSGFSIFSYTGTGASITTVGHGCSSEPRLVFVKNRSSTGNWVTYHYGAGATGLGNPNQASLMLNTTNASANPASGAYLSGGYFSNVSSTTITLRDVNNASNVNASGNNYIGYAFADVKGFSKMGSYTGNGNADGSFIYTGFTPAWVMIKGSSNAGTGWFIYDNKRNTYNPERLALFADGSDAEIDYTSSLDFLSNGFKLKTVSTSSNGSGYTYIYAAFASNPFVSSKGIPTTAR